jgi:very-short-patch-repair endonuclease
MNCKFCGKELNPNGFSHQTFCKMNPDRKSRSGENNGMYGKKGNNQFIKAKDEGINIEVSKETREKISKSSTGRIPNEETKKKISDSMKIAHKKGIAWNIGKSRWNNKKSYPEEFFTLVIENEFIDKNYTSEYNVKIYSIDFAWVDKKLAIEIDGEQHERFQEVIERDKRKDKLLISEGWKILRIKWKDMYSDSKKWIKIAYDFIHDGEA